MHARPGDLLKITTSEGVLKVIQVDDQPSPYVRFDWDFPRCPLDEDDE